MNELYKVVEMAMNQAPDVAYQLVLKERIDCVGWFFVMAVFMGVILKLWRKDYDEFNSAVKTALVIIGLLVSIGLISNPVGFIETIYVPKAVVAERIITMFGRDK